MGRARDPTSTTSAYDDGTPASEGEPTNEVTRDGVAPNSRKLVQMRPFRSNGDPKQFLVEGSIGDQRIRILIDTGATISFISRSIVKVLTPKLTVKSSELSIVLGNGDSQDTDHYVDTVMRLKHQPFESRLQLLDLPTTFDVIVGMDWLTRYDGRVNARARTLELSLIHI